MPAVQYQDLMLQAKVDVYDIEVSHAVDMKHFE
jgi:hypothetical protein